MDPYEESALFLARYQQGLQGYTYLTREPDPQRIAPPQRVGRLS